MLWMYSGTPVMLTENLTHKDPENTNSFPCIDFDYNTPDKTKSKNTN